MKIEEILAILNNPSGISAKDILVFRNVVPEVKPDGSFAVKKNDFTLASKIILNPGDVINLDKQIETTIGRAIVNRLIRIDPFGKYFPYVDGPVLINDFINECTVHLMNGKINTDQMIKLFDNAVWLTRFADMALPSLSRKILVTPKKSIALREKLVKEHADVIANGDISYVSKVEDPVLASIVDEIKDDPSYILYKLGKPDKGNHLKQTVGTFSPIADPTTGKYGIPEGNLMTGLNPEDYNLWANMNINGSYGRAVQTQDGGSIVKSLYGSMNSVSAGPKDSDCKTTIYKKVLLTKTNKKLYMWNYFNDGGKLTLLTPDNFKDYVGKICMFRSPLFCKEQNPFIVCNKCCGEIPYRTNLLSIGSLTSRVGFNFVQLSLKGFHNNTISLLELNPFEFMTVK